MLNRAIFESALKIAREIDASSVILFIDAAGDWSFWKESKSGAGVIMATQSQDAEEEIKAKTHGIKGVLRLPKVPLTRINQVKLSIVMSITGELIRDTERVVCISGIAGSGSLDTIMAIDLSKEKEVFSTRGIRKDLVERVKPEVIETVLNIALELSSEGREGKAVGTTFVIGDHSRVMTLSRPLILNPFKGYPEEARNILDRSVHETVKEFSLLDGAFVIREDGVIMAAGVHLVAALDEEGHLPGLGSRHMAAAGITDVTEAAAVTISGSTGIVRIFLKGRTLLEIERPLKWGERAAEGAFTE